MCMWPLTPKTSRRMHELRPNARQSWLWACYRVSSYTAELGIALEKGWDIFLKKSMAHFTGPVYIPVEQLETQTHLRNMCLCVGLGTYRGSRLQYVHTQCMPIWVPGSSDPVSVGPLNIVSPLIETMGGLVVVYSSSFYMVM